MTVIGLCPVSRTRRDSSSVLWNLLINCHSPLHFFFIHRQISNIHNLSLITLAFMSQWNVFIDIINMQSVGGLYVLACVLIVNLWVSSQNRHSDPGPCDPWPLTITNLIHQSASAHHKLMTSLLNPDSFTPVCARLDTKTTNNTTQILLWPHYSRASGRESILKQ